MLVTGVLAEYLSGCLCRLWPGDAQDAVLATAAPAPPTPQEAAQPLRAAGGQLAAWLGAPPAAASTRLTMAQHLSQQIATPADVGSGPQPEVEGADGNGRVQGSGPAGGRFGGLIEGLSQRIMAYLFREKSAANGEALRRFYYDFEEYAGMFMWKVRLS